MSPTVKHFRWTAEESRGRIAVIVENDMIEIVQISGHAVPADMMSLWNDVLGSFQIGDMHASVYADQLNRQRKNRIGVQVRRGMSGCLDINLRSERNPRLHDYPVVASLHISMRKKLNGRVKMWLGDFAALCEYLVRGVEDPTHLRSQLPHQTVIFTEARVLSDEHIEWLDLNPAYPSTSDTGILTELHGDE